MKRLFFLSTLLLLLLCSTPSFVSAQEVTIADYNRVDTLKKNRELLYNAAVRPVWIHSTNKFWYLNHGKDQDTYYIVDAVTAQKRSAFDHTALAHSLAESSKQSIDPKKLKLSDVKFNSEATEITFKFDNKQWKYGVANGELTKLEPQKNSETTPKKSPVRVLSSDVKWEAFIKDNNIWLYDIQKKTEKQLSYDGTTADYYSENLYWSNDSKRIVGIKIKSAQKRQIPLLESSPNNQIQPTLSMINYVKPGDVIDIRLPHLFDIDSSKEIKIDVKPYENQYALKFTGWRKDDRGFTFEFNQRGHQLYQIVEVAKDGKSQVIIEERFPSSFISYRNLYRYDTVDQNEIIWISERDGWKHLYLFDSNGALKNQITKGEWVVKEVLNIDEKRREILFVGVGKNKGEDPYNQHVYRVNFDGSSLRALTSENANHLTYFSKDFRYFVDSYSRPDLPGRSVLRDCDSGKIICELEQADISELLKRGWSMPEVFSAKGRDGVTDIWGTIVRPSNFDHKKSYPVIEYIYAGPHDSHVDKNFTAYHNIYSRLADLGFVIVLIDGMGTYNRSKAFHDVCWRNLKDAGFPDRIAWIKSAAAKYRNLDISNVGIYGYSAGGQNTLAALLFHGDFYKVGVSACGCHDNRMDKIWWNEQWMGYPIGPWYGESSNVDNAHLLKGRLLLINGELDSNVDPASTLQVADKLIKANKHFEMYYLPGFGHSLGGDYELRIFHEFFVRNIYGGKTPEFNK